MAATGADTKAAHVHMMMVNETNDTISTRKTVTRPVCLFFKLSRFSVAFVLERNERNERKRRQIMRKG